MPNELTVRRSEVGFPSVNWVPPLEGEEPEFIEGEFRDAPDPEEPQYSRGSQYSEEPYDPTRPQWAGGSRWERPFESGPDSSILDGEKITPEQEEFLRRMQGEARQYGYQVPRTYKGALALFNYLKPFRSEMRETDEFRAQERRSKLAELRAQERTYNKKYKDPSKAQKFGKGLVAFGKATTAAATPKTPIKNWYVQKPSVNLYAPKPPVETTRAQMQEIRGLVAPPLGMAAPTARVLVPHLDSLKQAGTPPSTRAIKAPFRDVEKFEGLGPTFKRLREVRTPKIEAAIYEEIKENGDIDIPSHIGEKVGRLGFPKEEINVALKRLRDLDLVVPTGRIHKGETELMVVGGAHG